MESYKNSALFKKGRIGSMTVKNRIVLPPMTVNFTGLNGEVTEKVLKYYEARAKGGYGMIITEAIRVNEEHGVLLPRQLRATSSSYILELSKLVRTVHKYDCRITAQLLHPGASTAPALNPCGKTYCSSAVDDEQHAVPEEMSTQMVKDTIRDFVNAAVICQRAEFDAVAIHATHGYLLNWFLSPHFNHRTDEYGGSFENRMRIVTEIIQGIKAACGKSYPVIVRMSADELCADFIPDTYTYKDTPEFVKAFEAAGVDAIDISVGNSIVHTGIDSYAFTPGWKREMVKALTDVATVPVIATNTVKNPEFALSLLEDGISDFVACGRSGIADPDWPTKAYEGRCGEIRQCLGCMYCFESLYAQGYTRCAVNPKMGDEYLFADMNRDGAGRKVAVVGAGPGGIQAAITLAERGFDVTVFEKKAETGGSIHYASKAGPFKGQFEILSDVIRRQAELLGVKFRLGIEATPDIVKEIAPEAVFLAIGAKPIIPNIPGIDKPIVRIANDVLSSESEMNGKVVVAGGGFVGLETSENIMYKPGKKQITIIDMLPVIGNGVYPQILVETKERLEQCDTEYLPKHMMKAVEDDGIIVTDMDTGEDEKLPADHVVLALGYTPDRATVSAFEEAFERVSIIGDTRRQGKIPDAMRSGLELGFGYKKP